MEKEEKRKSNKLINILIIIIIFIVTLFMYSKYIEPSNLKVVEYKIESEEIPKNFSGIKIIYFSDLLIGSTVSNVEVDKLVEKINLYKPDIVIFGGDLISKGYNLSKKDKKNLINKLGSIETSIGKYASLGSLDKTLSKEILSESGFTLINNSYELIYNEDLTPICLSGISSFNKGKIDLEASFKFKESNEGCYTLFLTHEPDAVNKVLSLDKKPNIILSANTLGGEVNIPFYGSIVKFNGSKKYYKSYYKKDNTEIYISNGIGTKKFYLRLNNTPSITLFRLKSTH